MVGISGPRSGQCVEGSSGVTDRAGQYPAAHQPRTVNPVRPGRDPASAGLETNDPAARSRNTNRAATIGSLGDGYLTSPNRSRGAARGPSRHSGVVPWGDGGFASVRFGVARKSELGSGGRPDRDGSGSPEPRDNAVFVVWQSPTHGPTTDGSGRAS